MAPRRKIVLFVVEGPTDKTTLFNSISELYERIDPNIQVIFKPFRGDITTAKYKERVAGKTRTNKVKPEYFEEDFYQLVIKPLQNEVEGVYPKYISEIVLITDTDGAYIPDEAIVEKKGVSGKLYLPDCIACESEDKVEEMRHTHEQKQRNINKMIELSFLGSIKIRSKTIPFKAYFFSRHLEHFLYDNANITDEEKMAKADEFYYKYLGKTEEFKNLFINNDYSSIGLSYEESWEYIKKGVNSLSRRTNLDLLIYDLWEEGNK